MVERPWKPASDKERGCKERELDRVHKRARSTRGSEGASERAARSKLVGESLVERGRLGQGPERARGKERVRELEGARDKS